MSTNKRAPGIDAVRYTLAFIVLWSHCWPLNYGSNKNELISVLTHGQTSAGSLAVLAFLGISGALITRSWQRRPKLSTFVLARIRRIYPGYLVATIISLMIAALLAPESWSVVRSPAIIWPILRMQWLFLPPLLSGIPHPHSINGPVWSLSYEVGCYIAVALLGVIGMIRPRIAASITLGALSLSVVNAIAMPDTPLLTGAPVTRWPLLVSAFGAGAFIQLADISIDGRIAAGCVTGLIVAMFVPPLLIVLAPILLTYIVLYIGSRSTIRLPWHGDLSYGLYLYAWPVQQATVTLLGTTSPWLMLIIAWPITHVFAGLSWHIVEHPALAAQHPKTRPQQSSQVSGRE